MSFGITEKEIERALKERVEGLGGMCLKFVSPGNDGMPDRICLWPGGRVAFYELKRSGEKPRPLQERRIEQLRRLGFTVEVIDNKNGLLKLHNYQVFASKFICEHKASAVLLDCGCGKTVITLTAVSELLWNYFDSCKVLVVCPIRVAQVWKDEAEKWEHLKGLRVSLAIGTAKERRDALSAEADVYVINRENVPWLVKTMNWKWDMLVIDELSSFKNHKAKRFKALMSVRHKVKRIVGLTGTPTGNGLIDLWAEYKLLDMGVRLGRFIGSYRQEYFQPDKTNGFIVYSYKPLKGAEERIYKKISDMTVSVRCTDVLKMPELISVPYEVKMTEPEMNIYRKLKRDLTLELKDGEITAGNAATLSSKLCQLANGAIYRDDGAVSELHNRKLDALEDIVEAQCGKPFLLAYWFRHDLERIEKRLKSLGVVYTKIDTQENITNVYGGRDRNAKLL